MLKSCVWGSFIFSEYQWILFFSITVWFSRTLLHFHSSLRVRNVKICATNSPIKIAISSRHLPRIDFLFSSVYFFSSFRFSFGPSITHPSIPSGWALHKLQRKSATPPDLKVSPGCIKKKHRMHPGANNILKKRTRLDATWHEIPREIKNCAGINSFTRIIYASLSDLRKTKLMIVDEFVVSN